MIITTFYVIVVKRWLLYSLPRYSMTQMKLEQPRLDVRLTGRLQQKKVLLDGYRPLSSAVVRRLQDHLRLLLTYHSNAIEGNTLTMRETQIVLEEGLTIGGHPMREHLEATNHAEAFDYMSSLVGTREPITVDTVLALHRLVLGHIDSTAGAFRTGSVYIRGARTIPPPARQVLQLVEAWVEWLQGPGLQYAPVVRAAISHRDFEAIHPFFDGNGRTGRLLLNLTLMKDGYPPALLLHSWRINYLRALDAAGTGNFNTLSNLVGRAVEGGLDLYLEACAQMADQDAVETPEPEEEYKPLPQLATESGYSADYLGWLVRRGRLEAIKRGGRWYSTSRAIRRYKEEVTQGMVPRGRPAGAGNNRT